jgi:hypothetical protein
VPTHRRLAAQFAARSVVVAVTHARFVVASILVAFDIPIRASARVWSPPMPH